MKRSIIGATSLAGSRSIRAPMLIAIGDNDYLRIEHAADFARLVPNTCLAVLPGTTHLRIVKRRAWLVPTIDALMSLDL